VSALSAFGRAVAASEAAVCQLCQLKTQVPAFVPGFTTWAWHASCCGHGMRSKHFAASLRFSLLASLGLLPLACAGAIDGGDPDEPNTGRKPTCSSPQIDAPSGVVTCAEGYSYRSKDGSCNASDDGAAPAPGADPEPQTLPQVTTFVDCTTDPTVCDAYRYGYCERPSAPSFGPVVSQLGTCRSGCAADADCGAGSSCRCNGQAIGTCVVDACESDADCEPGYHCASTPAGCGSSNYSCQSARDKCFGTQDCQAAGGYQFCLVQQDGHRECGGGSVCGRPFLVETEARVAPVIFGGDWQSARLAGPRLNHLTAHERAALAEHWTTMGQMEHASIAAFARFSLQLLSLGAPPELVEACTQALADETTHAKLCFGLASAYAGRAIGPGPLDVSGSLQVTSLGDIVELVIAEGCFGETSAALEALEAAYSAADPVIVAAYSQIARDEQRHAELAFRFVRWALEREPGVVSVRIARALCSTYPARAVRDVVEPCLEGLLKRSFAA
jgi:hypothetical protein